MKHVTLPTAALAGLIVATAHSAAADDARSASEQARPGQAGAAVECAPVGDDAIASLFDEWNRALAARDPDAVVALYGPDSILLPTMSNEIRLSPAAKRDYFVHFLHDGPVGAIDQREIRVGCNNAIDAGLYTFTFEDTGDVVHARYTYTYGFQDGVWSITSHHSSLLPEPTE